MIGNFLMKTGLALLRKSASLGFTAQSAEEIRKFFAIHPQIARSLGYSEPAWTGKSISEQSALNISTVWACQRNISETIAGLPLHLYQATESGKRVASEHPLDWVLYGEANEEMSSRALRETMTAHCVTWGNAFALKVKRGGTQQTIGLWLWTPDSVRMDRTRAGQLVYIHREGTDKEYQPSDVFHLPGLGFDGLLGYSVIAMARQSLGLASIQDEYVAKFFAAGGRMPYLLEKKIPFKDDQKFDEFREKWERTYGGASNFHKAPILEGDITLKELGMPFKDAELLASRLASVPEICRWFRMFPFMVGHMDQLTFNNVEHLGLQAVQYTYSAWLNRWETEINRQLLTNGEKGRYYAKHNINALLRGDFKTRMEGYSTGLQNGFLNPDFVCDLEDWDRLPNQAGQAYHIQLNMQTLPGTGEPTTAERAALAKIDLQQQQPNNGGKSSGN
jgi:HK97 family phage portal protein